MHQYFKTNEQYQPFFAKYPMWIYEYEPYKTKFLRESEAKEIYTLFLNTYTLSQKNSWCDENGNIFITYTNENIMAKTGLSEHKVTAAKRLLQELGLLKVVKQKARIVRDANGKVISFVNQPMRLYLLRPELPIDAFYNTEEKQKNKRTGTSDNTTPESALNQAPSSSQLSQVPSQQDFFGTQEIEGKLEKKHDKYNTYKDSQKELSLTDYSQAQIDAQNKVLVKHASEYMSFSNHSQNNIFSSDTLKIIKPWAKTPKDICIFSSIVLRARDFIKKKISLDASWLDFQGKNGSSKLQRFINQGLYLPGHPNSGEDAIVTPNITDQDIRSQFLRSFKELNLKHDRNEKIKNPAGYIFNSFKWLFVQKITDFLLGKVETANDAKFLFEWQQKQEPRRKEWRQPAQFLGEVSF